MDAAAAAESARSDAAVEAFHRLFYDTHDTTWKQTFWLGVTVRKCAFDLWTYQEILVDTRPDLIVETGTYLGGSAFYLAGICDLLGHGKIVTVDISAPPGRPRHRRITYLQGSSTDPGIVVRVARRARTAKRVMVVLDSNHSRDHVLRELEAYWTARDPRVLPRRGGHERQRQSRASRPRSRADGGGRGVPRDDRRLRGRPLPREPPADLQPGRLPQATLKPVADARRRSPHSR